MLLVEQGFFESRENAKRHIMEGIILVNDVPVDKAGTKVPVDARLRIKGHVMPYVGRGGFTDCALQNGAAKVFAIDVGTNQLDWKLRSNPQVVNMEKTNIKVVTKDLLGEMVDFISTDVSFISVTKIIPAVHSILKEEGSLVILIKPQFEAGREKVGKGGIIKDPKVHAEVIEDTLQAFKEEHLYCHGLTYSPIKGGSGNIEFLAWLKQTPPEREIRAADMVKVVEEAHSGLKG